MENLILQEQLFAEWMDSIEFVEKDGTLSTIELVEVVDLDDDDQYE